MANLQVFAGRRHPDLCRGVAEYLGVKLGRVIIEPFPDGELMVKLGLSKAKEAADLP